MDPEIPERMPAETLDVKLFSIEQNKALWAEISESVKESRLLERYAVIAIAAYWTFLIKDGKVPLNGDNYSEWMLVPILITALGGLRSLALLLRINLIGAHLRDVESSINYSGWENYLRSPGGKRSRPFLTTGMLIWLCILLVSVVAPLLFKHYGLAPNCKG